MELGTLRIICFQVHVWAVLRSFILMMVVMYERLNMHTLMFIKMLNAIQSEKLALSF